MTLEELTIVLVFVCNLLGFILVFLGSSDSVAIIL